MGCLVSQLAAKFAFFPPAPPTYQVKKRDDGKLVAVSTTSSLPLAIDDSSLDVLCIPTKRGNKIVAFYLRNPYARLTVLYSHGNAADLGQLYDLFVQLKANLRVNLMGYLPLCISLSLYTFFFFFFGFLNKRGILVIYVAKWGGWFCGFSSLFSDNQEFRVNVQTHAHANKHLYGVGKRPTFKVNFSSAKVASLFFSRNKEFQKLLSCI